MSITLTENDKRLELDILGYEFPEGGSDLYDVNWLVVGVAYDDGSLSFRQEDSCLLAYELRELTEALDGIVEGRETGLIRTFMEPYLSIAVTRVGEVYALQVRFVYDTAGPWKAVGVCRGLDRRELAELNERLKAMYARFPRREVQE
ncbi:MAG: hypothetical protein IKP17_08920 [Oscillospiraceae bacterium]|nr:hypothetical protein [Oscillospiraceae bacterium]